MKWVSELPARSAPARGGKWLSVAAELRGRPGHWAEVADGEKQISSARVSLGRLPDILFVQRDGKGFAQAVLPTEE